VKDLGGKNKSRNNSGAKRGKEKRISFNKINFQAILQLLNESHQETQF